MRALIDDQVTSLRENAERLGDSDKPGDALIGWLREFGRCASAYRGLAESILAAAAVHNFDLAAGGVLVRTAQQAGAIRSDVTAAEVFAPACGTSTASEYAAADPARDSPSRGSPRDRAC